MTDTTREALKQALKEITEVAERVDSWESFPIEPIEKAYAALAAADAAEAKPVQELDAVTLESALEAIEHVEQHNGPGRADEARSMLVALPDPADAKPDLPWQFMAEDDGYKRITELKTKSIIERDGYRVSGYILNRDDRMCLSYGQAIRWMSAKELYNVMHCIPAPVDAQIDRDALIEMCATELVDYYNRTSTRNISDFATAIRALKGTANAHPQAATLTNEGNMQPETEFERKLNAELAAAHPNSRFAKRHTQQPVSGAVDDLPPLPEAYGGMLRLGGDVDDVFTARQMREYARAARSTVNQVNAAQPEKDAAAPEEWIPITKPGQVKVGDKLRFTIGDDKYSETAKLILHPGTEQEEIIYNKRKNYYLITSMAIANKGSSKNVMFRAAIAAQPAKSEQRG